MPAVPVVAAEAGSCTGSASSSPRTTLPSPPTPAPKPFHLAASAAPSSVPYDDSKYLRAAHVTAGHAEDANPRFRASMEDACTITTLPCAGGGAFLGVYDGHGGSSAAVLAAATLHDDFADALSELRDPRSAFRSAYASVDGALRASRAFSVGTTAVTAFVHAGAAAVTVANAGDSRAVLGAFDGTARRLSEDHRACDAEEAARVRGGGGFVCCGRVNGVLSVSRALGDHAMKSAVVSAPHVATVALQPAHRFLILACDGLWDVVSDADAVEFVNGLLDARPPHSPAQAARALVRRALHAGSTDNVSVVVAVFDTRR